MKRKRKGIFQWIIAAALALAGAGSVVGYFLARSWLDGPGFRKMAEGALGGALRAEVILQPLEWRGLSSLATEGVIVRGYKGGPIERMEISGVKVSLSPSGLLSRRLSITAIELKRSRVVLGSPEREAPQRPAAPGVLQLVAAAIAPSRIDPGPIRSREAEVEWPTPIGAGFLRGTELGVRQRGSAWEISASGGKLRPALVLPEFNLISGRARLADGGVYLDGVELAGSGTGRIQVAGQIMPAQRMDLKFQRFDLGSLLPPGQSTMLTGTIDGEVTLRGSVVSGNVTLDGGRLRGGAPMEQMARFTGRPEYADLPLTTATAAFQSGGGPGQVEVQRMIVESAGLLAIEGSFTTGNDRIDGIFELGLPPEVLRRLPGSATAVFTRQERGYRWTQVRVAGPLGSPGNDLVRRLITAPLEASFQSVGNVIDRTFGLGGKVLDAGKTVGGAAIDGAGTIVEGAGGVLGGGVRLLGEGAGMALDLLPFGGRSRESAGGEKQGQ